MSLRRALAYTALGLGLAGSADMTKAQNAGDNYDNTSGESDRGPEPLSTTVESLKGECPNPWGVISARDPELFAYVQSERPELLDKDIFDEGGGIFGEDLTVMRAGMSLNDLIAMIIIALIVGLFVNFRGTTRLVGSGLRSATGGDNRRPEELGQVIPNGRLPQLENVLNEILPNALAALTPASRTSANANYAFVLARFGDLRFENETEGIELFKQIIKAYYLDLRIGELEGQLVAGGLAAAPQLAVETELQQLVGSQETVLRQLAGNPLNVTSIRRNAETRMTSVVQREVSDVMARSGRAPGSIRTAREGVARIITVPRLYTDLASSIREVRILESKIGLWDGRYRAAVAIAGTGAAPSPIPPAGSPALDIQRHRQAVIFRDLYESMQNRLADIIDERSLIEQGHQAIDAALPVGNTRRRIVKTGLVIGGSIAGYWTLRGLGKLAEIIFPPDAKPAKPELLPDPDAVEDALRKERERQEGEAASEMGKGAPTEVGDPDGGTKNPADGKPIKLSPDDAPAEPIPGISTPK